MPKTYLKVHPASQQPDDFRSLDSFESLGELAHLRYENICKQHSCQSLFRTLERSTNRSEVIAAISAIEAVTLGKPSPVFHSERKVWLVP